MGSCPVYYFSVSGTMHDTSSLKYASLKKGIFLGLISLLNYE